MLAAQSRVAGPAPRQPDIGIAIGIDPDGAGLQLAGDAVHAADVGAPDAGRQAERGPVGDADRIGLVVERNHAGHRAEDLFLRDAHLVRDVGENRGRDEVAALADTHAAGHRRRAFLLADLDIVEHRLQLRAGHQRTHRRIGQGRVADADRAGPFGEPLDHLVVDGALREDARSRGADLAGVEENA